MPHYIRPDMDPFAQAHYANLKIFGEVTEPQLTRAAYLEGEGITTLGRQLKLWIADDRWHIKEVEKLREQVGMI